MAAWLSLIPLGVIVLSMIGWLIWDGIKAIKANHAKRTKKI
jgi:hypothetical protein